MSLGMTFATLLRWERVERHLPIVKPARPLVLFGLAVLALAPISLAGMAFDPRMLHDGYTGAESVWLKPLKFQLAVSIHLVTVGLCMAALTEARRTDLLMRILVVALIGCSVFEIAYISLRGMLGLKSHFATDDIGAVFHYMTGIGAVAIVVITASIGVRVLRGRAAGVPFHLHLAVGLGLVISGVAGLVTGASIGEMGGPIVGAAGEPGLPFFGWSSGSGDLRVAHFFGLHAAQALPLMALAVGARGPLKGRGLVGTGAVLWSSLVVFTYFQALAGQPFPRLPIDLLIAASL